MPKNAELNLAHQFIENTDRNLFITGKAGTGKTTFLRSVKEKSLKRMVVVAPTGVAAINAKGVTIHSFFQMPFGPILPNQINHTSNQQRRFIEYVASNPQSLTLSVNRATAIGNCSSIAGRVNKKLMPLGYVMARKQPSDSHPNRFGEPSNMFGWSLFTLPQTASNDDRYGFAVEVTK